MELPTSSTVDDSPEVIYQAASIRGRGLLTKVDDRSLVHGHLMKVQSSSISSRLDHGEIKEVRGLQSVRSFGRYLEWHHEHQTSVLQNMRRESKMDRAREWMETAEALHAPLPVISAHRSSAETS
jgi:hypothetical protein